MVSCKGNGKCYSFNELTCYYTKNDSVTCLHNCKIKKCPNYLVCGSGANDIGKQCGGWTIEWQGKLGDITEGTTIYEGITEQAPATLSLDGQTDISHDLAIVLVNFLDFGNCKCWYDRFIIFQKHFNLRIPENVGKTIGWLVA